MPLALSPDLIVSDLDRAVRFYREALGFTEEDRVAGPEGPFFAMLRRDQQRLFVETPASPDPSTRSILAHAGREPRATVNLYLEVPDVALEEARLRAANVAFDGPVVKPYGMKELSLRDPDGYHWTLATKA